MTANNLTGPLDGLTVERLMSVSRRAALAGTVLAAAACSASAAAGPAPGAFRHGVASGDPLPDALVIWTRLEPSDSAAARAELRWEVATDADFRQIVKRGRVEATAANDWCCKVDVTGLRPGTRYHYRFLHADVASPVGLGRTAPPLDDAATAQLNLAVVSCSNHPAGYFNVYRAIAQRGDVDLVLHLGDYIYEYPQGGYATEFGRMVGRVPDPPHEIVSLDDYRRRYRQYRSDPDLQAAHACAPWLVTWDDHEFSNDAWTGGAENHTDATEGAWNARKAAALKAYYEWMPLRDPAPGGAFEAVNRLFQWGTLATIAMLETRIQGRAQPIDYATDIRMVPGPDGTPVPDLAGLRARFEDPSRGLLGPAQEAWLGAALAASRARGVAWQVLGNQVIMARVPSPPFKQALSDTVRARIIAALPQAAPFFELSQLGLPLNPDAWDGYPVARERLYGLAREAGARLVTVTGDTHSSWANELRDASGALRGVEFGCPSVTSPDFADLFTALGEDGSLVGPLIEQAAPDVVWHSEGKRGYTLVTLTPDAVEARFLAVTTIHSQDFTTTPLAAFRHTGPGEGAALAAI
jgi:alkaline phosphatase D